MVKIKKKTNLCFKLYTKQKSRHVFTINDIKQLKTNFKS